MYIDCDPEILVNNVKFPTGGRYWPQFLWGNDIIHQHVRMTTDVVGTKMRVKFIEDFLLCTIRTYWLLFETLRCLGERTLVSFIPVWWATKLNQIAGQRNWWWDSIATLSCDTPLWTPSLLRWIKAKKDYSAKFTVQYRGVSGSLELGGQVVMRQL
jgi:hypothetical protein